MEPEHSSQTSEPPTATLGLFEKRVEGDDALLELARLRFHQARMDAEMHGGTADELQKVLGFRPSASAQVVVHLPRDFGLLEEWCRERILELSSRFAGQIDGLVLHDRADLEARTREYRQAAQQLDSELQRVEHSPTVYVEYAAGLTPSVFAGFFELLRDLPLVSACVDVGHVGIRQARIAYAAVHPGQDICALKTQRATLPQALPEMQSAVATALPIVLDLIARLGAVGKPVHFHLHDGHPLSTFSPFGVSDHLSFFDEIPLDFEFLGRRVVPLMFGPAGLGQIVSRALETIGPERVSFTLEIHPGNGRLALGDAADLFNHWRDKTNAEQMNHWLSVLTHNHQVLRQAIRESRLSPG